MAGVQRSAVAAAARLLGPARGVPACIEALAGIPIAARRLRPRTAGRAMTSKEG